MKETYEKEVKKAAKKNHEVQIFLKQDEWARPFLLGEELDCYIYRFKIVSFEY